MKTRSTTLSTTPSDEISNEIQDRIQNGIQNGFSDKISEKFSGARSSLRLAHAEESDLPEILSLQYLAYQSEAELLGNPHIQPLEQTLAEVQAQFLGGFVFLKVTNKATGRILGSVRANVKDGTMFIGKLFVHPDFRGQGIGSELLKAIEKTLPHTRCELFTSLRSVQNLRLYERSGYTRFREVEGLENVPMVFLEKVNSPREV